MPNDKSIDQIKLSADAHRESAKLFYDLFKHVTTLSTGTIVVLATFIEKIFKSPVWLPLVVVTFAGLIVSVASALLAMFLMGKHIREPISDKEADWGGKFVLLCLCSFFVALACLTAFTIRNFLG